MPGSTTPSRPMASTALPTITCNGSGSAALRWFTFALTPTMPGGRRRRENSRKTCLRRLYPPSCRPARWPGHQRLFSFNRRACGRVQKLIGATDPKPETAVKEKRDRYTATDYGFTAVIDGRHYEVRGITRRETRLKSTIKGMVMDKGKDRFHVDTVDLLFGQVPGLSGQGAFRPVRHGR